MLIIFDTYPSFREYFRIFSNLAFKSNHWTEIKNVNIKESGLVSALQDCQITSLQIDNYILPFIKENGRLYSNLLETHKLINNNSNEIDSISTLLDRLRVCDTQERSIIIGKIQKDQVTGYI